MAIVGIETLIYGVENLEVSTNFFLDFGLMLHERSPEHSHFRLEEGSNVVLYNFDNPRVPKGKYVGFGVKETIWGVDTAENLEALVQTLAVDREVRRDADGTAHLLTDCGLPIGLRVYNRKKVVFSPDPINAPGNINRLNQHRKWRTRARPKTITHVVYMVEDYFKSFDFFRDRLNFRLSDHQLTFGVYGRAEGANEHHNIFFLDMNGPGAAGRPGFHHANFAVEDIDEVMIGGNFMTRRGWKYGFLGTGRHRIASALFCYIQCPAGGEVEYGADSDYLDDSWIPREWTPLFGIASWMSNLPPFLHGEPQWESRLLTDGKITP